MFDSEYDGDKEGGGTYFDSLKAEMEQQAEVSVIDSFLKALVYKVNLNLIFIFFVV